MAEGSAGNLYVIYEAFYLMAQLNPLSASNENRPSSKPIPCISNDIDNLQYI